ncbi:MAG: response regulator [Bacillota bacterium]
MDKSRKVLVIDDSSLVRLEVRRTLEKYGVEVLELNNAEDLFRYPWRYQGLNLLILDITLPGMDGISALEKIHITGTWPYLPVIMLTGRADRAVVTRALQAGAVDYIRKPFAREELLERVEGVLGPLVPPPENYQADSGANLEARVRSEISRAKRGDTPLSLLEINLPSELRRLSRLKELVELREQLQGLLREIDSVFLSKDRNLVVILPLTGSEGAAVVAERIRAKTAVFENQEAALSVATFPEDGGDEKELLQCLNNRLPANSVK